MADEKEIPTVLKEALARMGLDSSALTKAVRENPDSVDAVTMNDFIIYSKIYTVATQISASVCFNPKKGKPSYPVTPRFELI